MSGRAAVVRVATLLVALALPSVELAGCMAAPDDGLDRVQSNLTGIERQTRAALIRDTAASRGLSNGMLLAGIADAETSMSQCWTELDWACQGPASSSCGGGPVVAGAGDGPCELQQGGLGMFQFDGGTFTQTIARDGDAILTTEGNVSHAVDFAIAMVKRSEYTGATFVTDEDALQWMNQVRVDNELFEPWVKTVTHYYNGCTPNASCWPERFKRYGDFLKGVADEFGADFWNNSVAPVLCGPIPGQGATIDETDECFSAAGPAEYWRHVDGMGEGGSLLWTGATSNGTEANWASWKLGFVEAGDYLVEVSTASAIGTTERATYDVTHASGTDRIVISQAGQDGFLELGTFTFGTQEGQSVRVVDNTGEPSDAMKQIAVDAVRLTRLDTGGGGKDPSGGGVAGGCSVGGTQRDVGTWLWLGVVALILALRRTLAAR